MPLAVIVLPGVVEVEMAGLDLAGVDLAGVVTAEVRVQPAATAAGTSSRNTVTRRMSSPPRLDQDESSTRLTPHSALETASSSCGYRSLLDRVDARSSASRTTGVSR